MASAEIRTTVISEILSREGEVRPSTVVTESKPKDAPLHEEFEWNNSKAAGEHRLWQARRIIKTTTVTTADSGRQKLIHVPVQVRDDATGLEGVYKPLATVVRSASEWELAMNELSAKLRSLQHAVNELEAAAEGRPLELLPLLRKELKIVGETVTAIRQQSS